MSERKEILYFPNHLFMRGTQSEDSQLKYIFHLLPCFIWMLCCFLFWWVSFLAGLDVKCEACQRFFRDGLTISFTKILTDEAVSGWKFEIHVSFFVCLTVWFDFFLRCFQIITIKNLYSIFKSKFTFLWDTKSLLYVRCFSKIWFKCADCPDEGWQSVKPVSSFFDFISLDTSIVQILGWSAKWVFVDLIERGISSSDQWSVFFLKLLFSKLICGTSRSKPVRQMR